MFLGMDMSLVPFYTFIIFLHLINFSFILIASYFPFFPSIYYILLFYFQLLPSFPAELGWPFAKVLSLTSVSVLRC